MYWGQSLTLFRRNILLNAAAICVVVTAISGENKIKQATPAMTGSSNEISADLLRNAIREEQNDNLKVLLCIIV